MKTNWQTKKLKDICDVFADGDWIESKDQSFSGIRLIQTGNVGNLEFLDKESRAKYISEETFTRLNCTEIFPGDILISRLPEPVGRACIIPEIGEKMITAVDCTIVRPNESLIDKKFLLYFTFSNEYQYQVNRNLSGTTRQRISRGKLGEIQIPLPPLPTQQKIVARLDELLGNLAKAKQLRQGAIADTEKILSQTLREIFEEGKEKGWEERFIEEITKVVTKGTTPKTFGEGFTDSGVPFLKAENILGGPVDLTKLKTFISAKTNDMLNRSKTKSGDVLMTIAGTIGRVGFLPENSPEMNTNQAVAIIRPKEDLILPSFLTYALQSPFIQKGIWGGVVAAAIPNFSLTRIKEISMPLPPLPEQHEIVTGLDTLSAKLRELRQLQTEQLEDLRKLEKAYLREAFSGELVK